MSVSSRKNNSLPAWPLADSKRDQLDAGRHSFSALIGPENAGRHASGAEFCCFHSGSVCPGAACLLQNSFSRLGWLSVGYIQLYAVRMAVEA